MDVWDHLRKINIHDTVSWYFSAGLICTGEVVYINQTQNPRPSDFVVKIEKSEGAAIVIPSANFFQHISFRRLFLFV